MPRCRNRGCHECSRIDGTLLQIRRTNMGLILVRRAPSAAQFVRGCPISPRLWEKWGIGHVNRRLQRLQPLRGEDFGFRGKMSIAGNHNRSLVAQVDF